MRIKKRGSDDLTMTSANTAIFSKIDTSPVRLHKWALTISELLPSVFNGEYVIEKYTVEDVFPNVEYIENDPLKEGKVGVSVAREDTGSKRGQLVLL
jgi:hypothetical protein